MVWTGPRAAQLLRPYTGAVDAHAHGAVVAEQQLAPIPAALAEEVILERGARPLGGCRNWRRARRLEIGDEHGVAVLGDCPLLDLTLAQELLPLLDGLIHGRRPLGAIH